MIDEAKMPAQHVQNADLFQRIVEATPNAMVVIDDEGGIVLVNRSAELLFGYVRDELIGRPVNMLISTGPERSPGEQVRGCFDVPVTHPMGVGSALLCRRKDGSEVEVEVALNLIETESGRLTLASVSDITERRRQRDELRRSNAELLQFASIASHDLQEPLRMVASFTELLAQRYKGKLDERADKYIYYALDGARRMQRLVAELLAYSRVGSQGRPLTPVDVAAVVTRVLQVLGSAIREADASLACGPLPVVLADEGQLAQLFQNLIANALKFRGERAPEIRIAAELRGDRWQFSVQDNGIGVESKHSERIFQMFQRLHMPEKYEGSGIGLAIAKRIVERHHGTIWFVSEPGIGTTFYFTLQPVQTSLTG